MTPQARALLTIRSALEAVGAEQVRRAAGAAAIGTEAQLLRVQRTLREMERAILEGKLPSREHRDRGMGWMVTDSWPLESALGDRVLAADEAYLEL